MSFREFQHQEGVGGTRQEGGKGRLEASPFCLLSNRQVSVRILKVVLFWPSLSGYSEISRYEDVEPDLQEEAVDNS